MSEIPPFGGTADSNPILSKISASVSEAVTQAIFELAGSIPTDTNLADVRARLQTVEAALADMPEGYDDAPIRTELQAVQDALAAAASADALAAAVQRLASLESAVAGIGAPDLEPLTNRVAAVEEGLASVPQAYDDTPIKEDLAAAVTRLSAAEELLANLPEGVDLTPIQAEIAQLKARVDDLDPGFVNRPPTSSPIPPQTLTVGVEFSADFSGYFDDPDGDVLNAAEVSGALPPGIVQDGFLFSGIPTQTGNFTVTLVAADLYAAQVSRTISWTVQIDQSAQPVVTPAVGGFAVANAGTLPEYVLPPTATGFKAQKVL